MSGRKLASVFSLVASLGGCATSGAMPMPDFSTAVCDAATGASLARDELLDRLREARVILVGEQHGEAASHALQREVLEAVVAAHGKDRVVVAVEWWPASARLSIAGWLATDEPVESLAQATRWSEVWGHPLEAYTPLLLAVRRLGVRLVPINAEPGLARLVARRGVDGVPEDRRAELPPLDTGFEAHRQWFFGRMKALEEAHGGAHGHGSLDPEPLERMYLAQLVWDETMARNVVALARDSVVVVFAGEGHVEGGLGIPARLDGLGWWAAIRCP